MNHEKVRGLEFASVEVDFLATKIGLILACLGFSNTCFCPNFAFLLLNPLLHLSYTNNPY